MLYQMTFCAPWLCFHDQSDVRSLCTPRCMTSVHTQPLCAGNNMRVQSLALLALALLGCAAATDVQVWGLKSFR